MKIFEKYKLKRKINTIKHKIEQIEHKRTRSQAALIEAILSNTTPNDNDVDFFNKYTDEINSLRDHMHEMQTELDKDSKKKR